VGAALLARPLPAPGHAGTRAGQPVPGRLTGRIRLRGPARGPVPGRGNRSDVTAHR